ncbi:MAG TPA: phosphatase PAP2 family protein [Dehalococcoidia bacterium]
MNDRLQDLINGFADHSPVLDSLMKVSAVDLVFLIAVIPPLLWFWPASPADRARNQRIAAASVFAVVAALGGAWVLGHLHTEARPFVSDSGTRLLIHHSADNSFPSDHVTFAAAIAGALLAARPALGIAALAGTILIAVSRVFVGVHWPDDVVVALAIGLAVGSVAVRAEKWLVGPQRICSRLLPSAIISAP